MQIIPVAGLPGPAFLRSQPEYLDTRADGDPTTFGGTNATPAFKRMLAACVGTRKMIVPRGVYAFDEPVNIGTPGHIHIEFEAGAVLMASSKWQSPAVNLLALHSYGATEGDYNGRGGDPAARQIIHLSGPGRFDSRRLVRQGTGQGSAAVSIRGMASSYIVARDMEFVGTEFDGDGNPIEWSGYPFNDTGLVIMGGANITVDNNRFFGFQDSAMYLGGDFDGRGQVLKIINNHTDRCNFAIAVKRDMQDVQITGNSMNRGTVGVALIYASASGGPVNKKAAQAQTVSLNSARQITTPFWFERQRGLAAIGNKASELGITDNIHWADPASMFRLDGCKKCRISDNVLDGVQTLYPAKIANNNTRFNFTKLNTFGPVTIDGEVDVTHSTDNIIENNTATGIYAGVVEADANQRNNICRNNEFSGTTVKYALLGPGSIAVENNHPNIWKPGQFYGTFKGTAAATAALPGIDMVYLYPFFVETDITIKQLQIRVNVAGAASSAKIGIWANSNISNRPVGDPIVAFNTGVDTSTTGSKNCDVTDTPVRAGLYWMGVKGTGGASLPNFYSIPQYNQHTADLIGTSMITTGFSFPSPYADDMPSIAEGATFAAVSASGIPIVSLIT